MSTLEPSRSEIIADMLRAGDFFQDTFPKDRFRALLWEEAESESEDWKRKVSWQDMALFWTDADFLELHRWLEAQPDQTIGST